MSQLTSASLPANLMAKLCLLDSITDVTEQNRGKIVLSGSHGGLYPAAVASRADIRAVVFNDAGIGFENAGVKGVEELANVGMAAAAVDCFSARIGSADDMLKAGLISYVNRPAADAGVAIGMRVADALIALSLCPQPTDQLASVPEARWELEDAETGLSVLCVDSASLVKPDDAGRIIVTGSHGGLIGGDPARALKARAKLAVFNDAGVGKDETGISRLPALDSIGVAAVTVSSKSAAIGSARSAYESGTVSHANTRALELGVRLSDVLSSTLERF